MNALAFDLGKPAFGKIGQFEIVEEQIDKLVAAEDETEAVLPVALTWITRLAAPLPLPRQEVAFDEFLVSRENHVARTALAAKARLVHAVKREADLAAFQDLLDVPVLRRLLDRSLDQGLGPAQESLAVFETLAARIQPPVDDMNDHVFICLSQPASRACTTRPAGEPGARYSRARPFSRQTRRAYARFRHPFSSRTK